MSCTHCGGGVRHPIHCILPPNILESIARNGSPAQRRDALDTLATDNTLRALRAATAMPVSGPTARRVASRANPVVNRTIRGANNQEVAPGPVVLRAEGSPPTSDIAVTEAYDGLGHTFDLFWQEYARDSIDDRGMALDATVHYGKDYQNAFWDGRQMVFGDGDGKLFNRFTIALDIIGHELAHGVIEKEAGLVYFYESGALNEHVADVFGALVKQRALQQTADKADWLIGAGLLAPGVKGVALRSMAAPGTAYDDPVLGKDPQPAHMKNFLQTNFDNGGVHINSGIPNKAFHSVATALGGDAWDGAGRIWYHALLDPSVLANTGFRRFARVTRKVADRLYGATSVQRKAVVDGWKSVGIKL